jgi:hypothetical protein
MRNILNPGNDVMCSILSLLVETLIYGFVILLVVTLLLWVTISLFCVDNPVFNEKFMKSDVKSVFRGTNVLNIFHSKVRAHYSKYHWYENRPSIHRVSFPEYFSKRAESLLDICFLVFTTIVVIFILVPTLGFLYNNEFNLEHVSTAMSIDVVGHQWY